MWQKFRAAAGVAVLVIVAAALADESRLVARADEDSVLDQSMGQMNRAYRGLRVAVSQGDFAKVLELVPTMQENAVRAKQQVPHRIEEEKDESKRAEAQKRFRLQMISLIEEFLALEKAALAKDKDALGASLEKLRAIQKAGHDEFKEPGDSEH